MKSKRQTTIAKRTRERLVQERRELKREKKQAAAAARLAPAEPYADVLPESESESEPEPIGDDQ